VAPWPYVTHSVRSDEVELGIGFEAEPDPSLVYLPVADEPNQLYCGPNHPLYGRRDLAMSDLDDEPFILPLEEPREYLGFRRKFSMGRRVGGVADTVQERMWLIKLGFGIGILPQPIVDASDVATELWPLAPPADAPVSTVYFMAKRNRECSKPPRCCCRPSGPT